MPTRRGALTPARENDCAAVELRARFGEAGEFLKSFKPEQQMAVYSRMDAALDYGMPTVAALESAYGSAVVQSWVAAQLTMAVLKMGEEEVMDATDIRSTAEAMCMRREWRLVSVAGVMGFCAEMRMGGFKIYGRLSPRKILEAYGEYAERQRSLEIEAYEARKKREKEEAAAAHAREAVDWATYAAGAGLKDKSLNAALRRMMSEEAQYNNDTKV